MSLEVDGAAILRALAKNPRAFGMDKTEVNLLATGAVAARLKKGLGLPALRLLAKAVGQNDFRMIVGDLPPKDAKTLAKLDAAHPDYAAADAHWHRAHIIKLATGEAEPTLAGSVTPRPAPMREAVAAKKLPKIGKIMASAAQATARKVKKPGARTSIKGRR